MGCATSNDAQKKANVSALADYKSPEELMKALRLSGVLEDLEIIVGIDATKSNELQGAQSFSGHSLHDTKIAGRENPYQQVMRTATKFFNCDMDARLPLFYFGSEHANAQGGLTLAKECQGQADLLQTYGNTIHAQGLSGPTSFVPLIKEAMRRVCESNKYHVLLIITDGAVTDEAEHYPILNEASKHALSIVCVGVGDGPWEKMEHFDDKIPEGRVFDNFQFVPFRNVLAKESKTAMEEEFFFNAFMEVPMQYETIKQKLGYKPFSGTRLSAPSPPPPQIEVKRSDPPLVQQYDHKEGQQPGLIPALVPSAPMMSMPVASIPVSK